MGVVLLDGVKVGSHSSGELLDVDLIRVGFCELFDDSAEHEVIDHLPLTVIEQSTFNASYLL